MQVHVCVCVKSIQFQKMGAFTIPTTSFVVYHLSMRYDSAVVEIKTKKNFSTKFYLIASKTSRNFRYFSASFNDQSDICNKYCGR